MQCGGWRNAGGSLKLFKRRVRLDVGKYKFGNRVCDEWNGLVEDVVMADSLLTFKARLNPFYPTVPQVEHSILAKIAEKFGQKWVNHQLRNVT